MKKIIYLSLFISILTGCEKKTVDRLVDPQLIVSTDTLSFNGNEVRSLYISTKPAIVCKYRITSFPDWVTVSRDSGTVQQDIDEILVSSQLPSGVPGVYEGKLEIISTAGNKSVFLRAFVGENSLYSVPDSLPISVFEDSKNLVVSNEGNVPLNFTASTSNNLVSLPSPTGSIPVGAHGNIRVNVNRNTMVNGRYYSKLFLTVNNVHDTVDIRIDNFNEQKMMLSTDVIDAEYSKARDILVYISSSPVKVNIYKPSTGSVESIPLSFVPTCISVSSDGATAVAGHDGHISYIDLNTKTVIRTYSVSCNALDVVLGNNKWAYVFPKADQWENFRCVNLDLGYDNEVLHTGNNIYAGTKARMHPSGKFIYGADNGLSPSDIEKYDIQNGAGVYLYDSPYHGDYAMSGDLWFSEDGLRIFTRGKTVLKASELPDQDMIYNGTITLESTYGMIMWLDHSAAKNNLYLISSSDDYWNNKNKPFIYVYNSSNLVYKSKFALEQFLVPDNQGGGTFYDAEPYFVFSNSSGNNLFVLTKATGAGLVNEWAIQKIGIE